MHGVAPMHWFVLTPSRPLVAFCSAVTQPVPCPGEQLWVWSPGCFCLSATAAHHQAEGRPLQPAARLPFTEYVEQPPAVRSAASHVPTLC